jgi:hypothetical protein
MTWGNEEKRVSAREMVEILEALSTHGVKIEGPKVSEYEWELTYRAGENRHTSIIKISAAEWDALSEEERADRLTVIRTEFRASLPHLREFWGVFDGRRYRDEPGSLGEDQGERLVNHLHTGRPLRVAAHWGEASEGMTDDKEYRRTELARLLLRLDREWKDALLYGDGTMPDWVKHRIDPTDPRWWGRRRPLGAEE